MIRAFIGIQKAFTKSFQISRYEPVWVAIWQQVAPVLEGPGGKLIIDFASLAADFLEQPQRCVPLSVVMGQVGGHVDVFRHVAGRGGREESTQEPDVLERLGLVFAGDDAFVLHAPVWAKTFQPPSGGAESREPRYDAAVPQERHDVIVLGAGVAGSAAAYALSSDQRVLVLEQHAFLHKLGSSHGGSRIFRYAYDDPRYVALAAAADELWQALERDQDEKLLTRTGGLDLGAENAPELAAIEGALLASGQAVEWLGPAEVSRRFPAFRLAAGQAALYQPQAGILAATRSVNALLRGAASRGAELRDREPVTGLELGEEGVTVTTPEDRYRAARLVVTAGPWLGEVLSELGLPLSVEQQQVLYVRAARPQAFAPERMPVFIHHDREAEVYGFPLFDDPVAIKISDHAGAPAIRLAERRSELMRERAEATVRRARRFLPGLAEELRRFEMCLYTKTPDQHFILDRHPEHENVVIGGGFSGHGFKFGPVLGEILRELALTGGSSHDLSLFGLGRFATRAAG